MISIDGISECKKCTIYPINDLRRLGSIPASEPGLIPPTPNPVVGL